MIEMEGPSLTRPEHQIYVDLMNEARLRIIAIQANIDAKDSWVPRLLEEFLYLQLRMLCESIAVGCLVAHGDVTDQKTLKSWRPPDMIKQLEKLNSNFYPRGVRFRKLDTGVLHLDDHNVPQLSKSDLVNLWELAGGYLHRGSAKNLLATHGELFVNLDNVMEYALKILNLLDQHIISSADNKHHLLVALANEDSGGNATVFVAESP